MVEVTVKKVGINMVEVTRVKDTLFKVTMVEFTVVEVAMVKVTMVVVTRIKVTMVKVNKVDINMVEVTMVTGWLWLRLISSMASIVYGVYRSVNLVTFSILCRILSINIREVGIWATTRYICISTQKPAKEPKSWTELEEYL